MTSTAYSAFAAEKDITDMSDNIVSTVNDLFRDKLSREITENDFDFENSYKIYVGTDIFKLSTVNSEELKNKMESTGYIYELPIYVDGDTVIVNFAKGQPLDERVEFTEEEKQEVISNVGKWQITAVKFYENEIVNYNSDIQSAIGEIPEDVMLVGGLPHFKYAVALLADENGIIKGIFPLSEVPGANALKNIQTDIPSVYDYEQMKNYINQLPPLDSDEAGSYGFLDVQTSTTNENIQILAVGVAITLIALCTAFVFKAKKQNNKMKNINS
jgi:hypothetical protein